MHEPLLDRIRDLERSNRRWKTACAILAAALLAVLTSGTAWIGIYGYQALTGRAMRAAEEARMQEMRARAAAEAAQRMAEEAMEKARRAGEAK